MEWLATPETLTTLIATAAAVGFGGVALLEARLTTRASARALRSAAGRLTVPTFGLVLARWGDREPGPACGREHEGWRATARNRKRFLHVSAAGTDRFTRDAWADYVLGLQNSEQEALDYLLSILAQRVRGKALLLMDADTDFACDLICASFLLDDLRVSQRRFYDDIAPLQRNS